MGTIAAGDDPAERGALRLPGMRALAVEDLQGTPDTASGVGSWEKPCRAWALVTCASRASSSAVRWPTRTFLGKLRWSEVCICSYGVMPATGEAPKENP